MFWQVSSYPKCTHHVFLSHCQEDRDGLIVPVHEGLGTSGIVPWLDKEDYYYGRDSRSALRDGILRSRHIVFFVTDAMLENARGWCVYELAFAELLGSNLQAAGGQLANVILPLFLVEQNDERLPRSVWQLVRDRGVFWPRQDGLPPGEWCIREIRMFLYREQSLALEVARMSKQEERLARKLSEPPGLKERVTRFHPAKIPPQ